MAEKKKSTAQSAIDTAGSLKNAAKLAADVGRVFAGDMSAIKSILTNRLVWGIILVALFIPAFVGMIIGGAITGVIEYIARVWEENWEENMLDQAISSNGDIEHLKTTGWWAALGNTVVDYASDIWDSICNTFDMLTGKGIADANGRDNSKLKEEDPEAWEAGHNPDAEDYENTMQAIMQNGETVGLTPALKERLDMIQGRVKQRGVQLKNSVYEQYVGGKGSAYNSLAKKLTDRMEDIRVDENGTFVLYAGFSEALSEANMNFDLSVFDLSELQALKILAIFSIQHDCQLTDMDMWTLMDYCGWYDGAIDLLEDIPDSIYEVVSETQQYGSDIGGVTTVNAPIPVTDFEMGPLIVPVWKGSCAPQWYYEELSQLRKEYGSDIDITQYERLAGYQTYGIIDRLFYSAKNNLTIMRNEYSDAGNYSREDIAALGDDILEFWAKYVWIPDKPVLDGIVSRSDSGEHIFTYSKDIPQDSVKTIYDIYDNIIKESRYINYIELYEVSIDIKTGAIIETPVIAHFVDDCDPDIGIDSIRAFNDLKPETKYRVKRFCIRQTIEYTNTYDEATGELIGVYSEKGLVETITLEDNGSIFETHPEQLDAMAYQLYAQINLSFEARSVDEIAFDLLGIWPGDLTDTVQVERVTHNGNLVGKNEEGQYTFCLRKGYLDGFSDWEAVTALPPLLQVSVNKNIPEGTLLRPNNAYGAIETGVAVTKLTFQYGIQADSIIYSPDSAISSGWRMVDANGDTLLFEIDGNRTYYVYCRVTQTTEMLYYDGTTSQKVEQILFPIDVIAPVSREYGSEIVTDKTITNGDLYANGHLGNEHLRLNWTDVHTAEDGTQKTMNFTRMTGYQYETYVDMVMALCELLNVPYDDWDPAVKRAQELGWAIKTQ